MPFNEMPPREHQDVVKPKRSSKPLIVLCVIALGLVGVWVAWKAYGQQPPAPTAEGVRAALPLPPADTSVTPATAMADADARLRAEGEKFAPSSLVSKWLSEKDALRRLTAAVGMVGEGKTPRSVLAFLAPTGEFTTARQGEHLVPSPESYARYAPVTEALTALNPTEVAKSIRALQPYIDTILKEIAPPNQTFADILHGAILGLSRTPIPEKDPELKPHGILFIYADPALEGLTPAQKQLLRVGPAQARAVQAWLAKLDRAVSPVPAP